MQRLNKHLGLDTSQEERILPLLSVENVKSHHFMIASSALHAMQCATIVPSADTLNMFVDRRKSVRSASTTARKKMRSWGVYIQKEGEQSDGSPWAMTLSLNGEPTKFEIDTDAEVTVISPSAHRKIGSPALRSVKRTLRGPSNHVLPVKGHFMGKLKRGDREVEQELFVVSNLHKHLLGRPAIQALDLAVRVSALRKDTKNPVEQFPSLFKDLGKLQGEYIIKLQEDAKPYALTVPRRVAIPLMQLVDRLERMERSGVITRVSEPTEWCAGIWWWYRNPTRSSVDFTRLNQSVCRERHPLPAVEYTLAGARVFSKLDANSSFWQIPLSRDSALLTTFITPFGRFCFHRLPFGITSAPEHFQR